MRDSKSKIAKARDLAGLSQQQVAKMACMSLNSYQRYETGLREPRAGAAIQIAKTLNSTVEELFGA